MRWKLQTNRGESGHVVTVNNLSIRSESLITLLTRPCHQFNLSDSSRQEFEFTCVLYSLLLHTNSSELLMSLNTLGEVENMSIK